MLMTHGALLPARSSCNQKRPPLGTSYGSDCFCLPFASCAGASADSAASASLAAGPANWTMLSVCLLYQGPFLASVVTSTDLCPRLCPSDQGPLPLLGRTLDSPRRSLCLLRMDYWNCILQDHRCQNAKDGAHQHQVWWLQLLVQASLQSGCLTSSSGFWQSAHRPHPRCWCSRLRFGSRTHHWTDHCRWPPVSSAATWLSEVLQSTQDDQSCIALYQQPERAPGHLESFSGPTSAKCLQVWHTRMACFRTGQLQPDQCISYSRSRKQPVPSV